MTADNRWARTYKDDPVTAELLSRGVVIPFHEDLHRAADAFIYGSIKNSLGRDNSERLGLHHYATHIKLGIAQEYLADLKVTLDEGRFDLDTGPLLVLGKLLSGFFVNLLATFDNLTQEVSLVYGLGLDRKSSISRLFDMLRKSGQRKTLGREEPIDRRLSMLPPVLADPATEETIERIGEYRNYLTHSRPPATETSVRATATVTLTFDLAKQGTPSRTVASTASGGVRFPRRQPEAGKAGSDVGSASSSQQAVPLALTQRGDGKWRLPQADRLDILPSRIKEEDLDPEDITVSCDAFYRWTVSFLGKAYQQLTEDFKRLV